jgi:hypothetical protein
MYLKYLFTTLFLTHSLTSFHKEELDNKDDLNRYYQAVLNHLHFYEISLLEEEERNVPADIAAKISAITIKKLEIETNKAPHIQKNEYEDRKPIEDINDEKIKEILGGIFDERITFSPRENISVEEFIKNISPEIDKSKIKNDKMQNRNKRFANFETNEKFEKFKNYLDIFYEFFAEKDFLSEALIEKKIKKQ